MSTNQEKKATGEQKKVGVYICHCGGNISDHVDVEKLADSVKDLDGVEVVHTNTFMCSDPGQELIQNDIKDGKINRVVVASCAPSLHELTFRGAIKRAGMNPYLYEHANIREQVSWVHHGHQATEKATGLVAGAVAKALRLQPLEPIRVEARRHATVIGGGVAGLRAAYDLACRGLEVALVEKSPFIGGKTASLGLLVPTGEKAEEVITQIAAKVMANDKITIYSCTEVVAFEGFVGNFRLTLQRKPPQESELKRAREAHLEKGEFLPAAGVLPDDVPAKEQEISLETGAIVMATGFKSYTPKEGEYGYLQSDKVITLAELVELIAKYPHRKGRFLQVKGKSVRRLAFIHCVGSRQIPGIHEPDQDGRLNEYCSRTCCAATLQAAVQIRRAFPETQVFDFYRDIRTYGRGQEEFYQEASKRRVTFFRFEPEDPPQVQNLSGAQFPLQVSVKDTLTFGEQVDVPVDLVVLATGMEPTPIKELVEMMKLPVGADGFLQEVHPKLRPVEVANTGILLAGTCQAPMDVGEACNAAGAAAAKTTALLARGYVELDPFVARVDLDKCNGSGLCQQACPIEGAIQMKEKEVDGKIVMQAEITPALCTGCGICVAVCPSRALDINGWTLEQYEAMVDAIVAA